MYDALQMAIANSSSRKESTDVKDVCDEAVKKFNDIAPKEASARQKLTIRKALACNSQNVALTFMNTTDSEEIEMLMDDILMDNQQTPIIYEKNQD